MDDRIVYPDQEPADRVPVLGMDLPPDQEDHQEGHERHREER